MGVRAAVRKVQYKANGQKRAAFRRAASSLAAISSHVMSLSSPQGFQNQCDPSEKATTFAEVLAVIGRRLLHEDDVSWTQWVSAQPDPAGRGWCLEVREHAIDSRLGWISSRYTALGGRELL